MTELEYAQLELDAAIKGKDSVIAQRALNDAQFAKAQLQVDARISQIEAVIVELKNAVS